MERPRLALAIGLVVAAVLLAGCLEDLERRELDAGWEPNLTVQEAPFPEVHGSPAMVVADGPVELPSDAEVTVTNLHGELTRQNASIGLQAMRVNSDAGTQRADEAEGELALSADEQLLVTFVPADDAPRWAHSDRAWNVSLEIQWRFRAEGDFDAGRLQTEANLTPEPVPELGVGVVEREAAEVHRLVFEAIDVDPLPDELAVEVLRLGGGSVETLEAPLAALEVSDGTARVTFADNLTVPEGAGYLLFRLDGVDGVATTALRTGEDPLPGPGTALVLAGLGLATLAAARRRG